MYDCGSLERRALGFTLAGFCLVAFSGFGPCPKGRFVGIRARSGGLFVAEYDEKCGSVSCCV